ncbi:aminotransferase class III-fold pyridoxal phosphate-dependent enzyme [Leptospira santarosai]|uniref:aminotransferase class III-fold pyridoxal phosphate-dependent enzyme n=1 Tax=Leptospira santarosai TaxID=28183 RepID=UPI0002985A25|nr:aminotransferase class III-fold pyridoxal phosphate-dependent enzyme [Leptospira santarosai]EKS07905.1 cytidylyltransferase [Leptospira santarosai str. JET]
MKKIKILGILQARTSSSRLPQKVLMEILNKSMLELQLERESRSKMIDKLVVATSDSKSDDNLENLCKKLNIACVRGSLDDVLDRFYQAAKIYEPQWIVRLTGDCPLVDPFLLDEIIQFTISNDYDYGTNAIQATYPDGLDVEVFKFSALEDAWNHATLLSQREHVTSYINRQSDKFKIGHYKSSKDLSHLRWTVDEREDFELVKNIYENLYPANREFTTNDILNYLELNPQWKTHNLKYERNEGYKKSLMDDKKKKFREKRKKSLEIQELARKRIPGMVQLLSKRPDLYSYGVWPGYYEKAKGAEVWDLDGNRYIDMSIGGIGANVLGYADPDVDAAVLDAVGKGNSSSLNCPEELRLADLLCEIHPWAEKVRFGKSGGESMTIAVRIARAYTKKDKVAFCGYHGWHDWYLAANLGTENALGEHLISGLLPNGVPKALKGTSFPFRYNHIEDLEEIVSKNGNDLAAIIMEPMRGYPPTREFLDGVHELSKKTGAVLIIDEISSGFRINSGGAHLVFGFKPDIAVFSKSLGNGYPIAAVIGKGSIMDAAQTTFISSTFWTERIGPTAAIAMIEKHRKNNAGLHLKQIGDSVQKGWKDLLKKHNIPGGAGGLSPIGYLTFDHPDSLIWKAFYIQEMLERGFLATTGFYSMYAHNEKHVRSYLESADDVLKDLSLLIEKGEVDKYLIGEPAVSSFSRIN